MVKIGVGWPAGLSLLRLVAAYLAEHSSYFIVCEAAGAPILGINVPHVGERLVGLSVECAYRPAWFPGMVYPIVRHDALTSDADPDYDSAMLRPHRTHRGKQTAYVFLGVV